MFSEADVLLLCFRSKQTYFLSKNRVTYMQHDKTTKVFSGFCRRLFGLQVHLQWEGKVFVMDSCCGEPLTYIQQENL